MCNKNEITKKIGTIIDPMTNNELGSTNSIKFISINDETNTVNLIITLPTVTPDSEHTIKRAIAQIVKVELGFKGLVVDFEVSKNNTNDEKKIKYIGVASGKGGVGKSTVAANLAYALSKIGKKVGIIDADIYGSSIPSMLNMEVTQPRGTEDQKIIPFNYDGIELISTEFFMEPDSPLMWRGPMLSKMLTHFFNDILWDDEMEYVVVDLPPGTGDVAIDIQSFVPECKMIIVTTPHTSAAHVAVKAGFAAIQLKHEILGVIENMSYFMADGIKHEIFGSGGGKVVSAKLKTKILSKIPIGQPVNSENSIYDMHSEIGTIYIGLANKIIKEY